jgi:uncharacterized membrane protein YgaE (UPF0421/DUF939 family)
MKRLKTKIFGSALAVLGMLGLAKTAYMAPTTTPTEVLDTVVGSAITTVVNLVTVVITDYFPYVLVFAIIIGMLVWIKKFAHVGSK